MNLSTKAIAESIGNNLDSVLMRYGVRACSLCKIAGDTFSRIDIQTVTSSRSERVYTDSLKC